MTTDPIAVSGEDSLVSTAKILADYNFNGLPVIDGDKKVVGIITEYDLISKGDALHLPTLMVLLGNIDVYKKDSGPIKEDLKKLLTIKVKDVMNSEPLTVRDDAPIDTLPKLFAEHHKVNPIPVVENGGFLAGVVSRYDLVRFFATGATKPADEQTGDIPDESITRFVGEFEKRFVLVSKGRARFWPIASILFAIVGFIIAFAIILRVTIN